MKSNDDTKSVTDNKSSRRKFLTAAVVSTAALGLGTGSAPAQPNGTRPTILNVTSVVAVNATQMRVTGRLTDLTGFGLWGMRIDIFSVGVGHFSRWATVYTNNGNFIWTGLKVPVGSVIQVVAYGNGAYSQPFPTFGRV